MPRARKNLDLSLGLASIPVQLFRAASGQGIAFQLLHARCGSRLQTRLECPLHGVVPRDEIVKGYEYAKDEYLQFTPEEIKSFEEAASSTASLDAFVPADAIDPVYFEDTYYLEAGKNVGHGYRLLVEALRRAHRIAVGTFTWRGPTTPIAIRVRQDGLLLQRLYFADEGAGPK
jgi:DNA end-binding protein Ku